MSSKPKSHTPGAKIPAVFSTAFFAVLFIVAALLTGIGGLYALSGSDGQAARALLPLRLNLLLILALGLFLVLRLRRVFFSADAERSAPILHQRFILIFSIAALLPAILVGLFFSALMSRNISDIFGPSVRQTMEVSDVMSSAYLDDKRYELRQRVYDIAGDLNRDKAPEELANRITYSAFLIRQARFRQLPAIYVIDGKGRILSQAEGRGAPQYVLPPADAFEFVQDGSVILHERADIDFIGALYKLQGYEDAYLYTGLYVVEDMLANVSRIDAVEKSLETYTGNVSALNKVFFLVYVEVALLIFFAAIWLGLLLANRIVTPLGHMVNAAEKVRSGDLTTRINVTGVWDEIGDLANAFNRMTRQLYTQRQDLVREHNISEQQREFSEAVLSGVSAGVIGLSPQGRITVMNSFAENLLGIKTGTITGKPLSHVLKEFLPVFKAAQDNIAHIADDQVNLETPTGLHNLDIRVSAYKGDQADTGWVITFDDMTRLVAAQRHSAWRDVARRIAHEIKNPLTPILLSAERLQRKYTKEITSEPEVFEQCTQTIIRQVDNMGRMVDEFSAFARMPAPILQTVALGELIDETLFAQRVAFPDVKFSYERTSNSEVHILCDERLISQALTNIYKNAGESISRRIDEAGLGEPDGKIRTVLSVGEDMVCIDIFDNGEGWPQSDKDRLLEPYMTTRDKGTGLGLAIVNRIAEDHGGRLTLEAPQIGEAGAHVKLCLPRSDVLGVATMPKAHHVMVKEQEI